MLRKFQLTLNAGKSDYDKGDISGIAFGDPVTPVEMLFLHANGFNGLTYQSILEPFDGKLHAAALDLRGHGKTELLANPSKLTSWNRFRDDIIEAIAKCAPNGLILGGHSLGATTALTVAAEAPHLVHGLVLVEPVIPPGNMIKLAHVPLLRRALRNTKIARNARNRSKTTWSSPESAETYMRECKIFSTWREPFLRDYLVDGLSFQPGEEPYALTCDPAWESAIFSSFACRPWRAFELLGYYHNEYQRKLDVLAQMSEPERARQKQSDITETASNAGMLKVDKTRIAKSIPIVMLTAENNSTVVPGADKRIHAMRPDAVISRVPGTSHFLPMERPYVVRDALALTHRAWKEDSGGEPLSEVRRTINDSIGVMG